MGCVAVRARFDFRGGDEPVGWFAGPDEPGGCSRLFGAFRLRDAEPAAGFVGAPGMSGEVEGPWADRAAERVILEDMSN